MMVKKLKLAIQIIGIVTIFIAVISIHNGLRSYCVFCVTGLYIQDNLHEKHFDLFTDDNSLIYAPIVNSEFYITYIDRNFLSRAPPV